MPRIGSWRGEGIKGGFKPLDTFSTPVCFTSLAPTPQTQPPAAFLSTLTMLILAVDELHLALVTSTKASARLVNVDVSAALAMPGVVGFLDHSSIPGSNVRGPGQCEEIFATSQVCIFPVACRRNGYGVGLAIIKLWPRLPPGRHFLKV